MNVSLPPELTAFIDKKVKAGLYEDASDVMRDALRHLEQRERATNGIASLGKVLSMSDGTDVEGLVFLVLMLAAKDAGEDLEVIVDEVKAINKAKESLRELTSRFNKDVAAMLDRKINIRH